MTRPAPQWITRLTPVLTAALLLTGCASKSEHPDSAGKPKHRDIPVQAEADLFSAASRGDETALEVLRDFAESGYANAQWDVAMLYQHGFGVPKNLVEAVAWYRKAAEKGNLVAQESLGLMYEEGEGVPKDLVMAYMWVNLAAEQSEDKSGYANATRSDLEKQMTPDQIAKAQKLSREWKPK